MDTDIHIVRSQLSVALKLLHKRAARLEETTQRLSRHYNKLNHTVALVGLIEEVLGLLEQDPDVWDDEPDIVPF